MVQSVLFFEEPNTDLPEFKKFAQEFEVLLYDVTTREQFIEDINTKYSHVSAIYGAWDSIPKLGEFSKDLIDQLPESLKLITVCSAGFGRIDLEALRARGINFCNTPTLGAAAVADTALYHILNGFRRYPIFEKHSREHANTFHSRAVLHNSLQFDHTEGRFVTDQTQKEGYYFGHYIGPVAVHSPAGKNVTIVGFGEIGKQVGKRLSALDMKISYVKRTKLSQQEEKELGYPVTFAENLEQAAPYSDSVVLCLPGTPETKHIINKAIIDKFPKGVIIVNVGRGILFQPQDLDEGLKSGQIGFLGSDVFPEEPVINYTDREDVSITPHIGSSTVENFDNTARFCLKNIAQFLKEGKLESLKN